jgi:hypothetical protein
MVGMLDTICVGMILLLALYVLLQMLAHPHKYFVGGARSTIIADDE